MENKRICIAGAYAVGKTSLVEQYLCARRPGPYRCTLGVQISRIGIPVQGRTENFSLWDIQGSEDASYINVACLLKADALVFVADGTRQATLHHALSLRYLALDMLGPVPNVLMLNKADLDILWAIPENILNSLARQGVNIVRCSAVTGALVAETFAGLAAEILGKPYPSSPRWPKAARVHTPVSPPRRRKKP
jgi:GTPase SAR1 family protein